MNKIAVIIGRFQSPALHDGYKYLLNYAQEHFDSFGVLIGSSPIVDYRNPLPFLVRKFMIEDYPYKRPLFIDNVMDVYDDRIWSSNVDEIIEKYCCLHDDVVLLGSRDSFCKSYTGNFRVLEIAPYGDFNATSLRNCIQMKDNAQFLLGFYSARTDNLSSYLKHNSDWVEGFIFCKQEFLRKQLKHKPNLLLKTDSYKMTHAKMYNPNTQYIFSYLEARVGSKYDSTLFFGLQYLLKTLEGIVVTMDHIDEAEQICNAHIGPGVFNRSLWEYIVLKLNGKLPLEIRAVPEGTQVPVGNVLMTIVNTDPNCAFLTNYMESYLLHIWYSCTVATLSKHCKNNLQKFVEKTCDTMDSLEYMLHDFGYRGVSSDESSGIGGLAHLVNFRGTDTLTALMAGKKYYSVDIAGYSVNASEHSIMSSMGKEGEMEVIERLLDRYPSGILSIVMDSYDIFKAVEYLGTHMKEKVLNRNGKTVIRPDSGNPVEITLRMLNKLEEYFGSTRNFKGYKELNPKVGLIYGDGINIETIQQICREMLIHDWAANNIIFGMGGGLLQKVNRDTQRFAFKCSAMMIDNTWVDVYKDPVTSHGQETKTSKAGHLILTPDFVTKKVAAHEYPHHDDILQLVFKNGFLIKEFTMDEVRFNAN